MTEDPNAIPEVLEGLSSPKASVRYGCAGALAELSQTSPQELYPYIGTFVDHLDSKYRILTWNALAIIANLTRADKEKKFDQIFNKYYDLLKNDYLVTVANVVSNSAKIALAKPYLTPKIIARLLETENRPLTSHLTEECRRVIIEKTIEAFTQMLDQIEQKEDVVAFAKRQLESPRVPLQKKARIMLERVTKSQA